MKTFLFPLKQQQVKLIPLSAASAPLVPPVFRSEVMKTETFYYQWQF